MRFRSFIGILLLPLCLLLLIPSCSSIEGVLNFSRPEAQLEKIELTGLNFDRADLLVTVRVENPNPIGVRLAGIDYSVAIDETRLIDGDLEKGVEIKAGGSSIVEVPLSLSYPQIFSTVSAARQRDELFYAVELGFKVAAPGFGTVRIPVKAEGIIPSPKLPRMTVDSLRVNRISLTRIELAAEMTVENPNAFSLDLQGFTYDLQVADRTWIEGKEVRNLSFPRKKTSTVALPISLNIVEVGRSVVDLLSGNRTLGYRFSGDTTILTDVPLLSAYPFSFAIEGETEVFR